MDEEQREHDSLVNFRTHLTVLTLAVGQLRRRHGDTADIERLCAFAEAAIQQLNEDIAAVQAILIQGERREASRQAHLRIRPLLTTDAYSQETGPLPLPSHSPHARASGENVQGDRPKIPPHAKDAECGNS